MVDIIITGIGGQGTVSLGHLIADTLTELEIPFVAAETHGMSQRGGSVIFHLRIGSSKLSPLIEKQTADCIIAGEPMEALRSLEYLKPNGIVISDTYGILSPVARQMGLVYPEMSDMLARIKSYTTQLFLIDATNHASDLGSAKVANIILLGALMDTNLIPIEYEQIVEKITSKWPNFVDLNLAALKAGRSAIQGQIIPSIK